MIPKVIHYCWFGNKPLPKEVKKCIESWKKYAPDYKIIQWNESNFNVHQHPFMDAAYKANAWAFVSDYARLKIIFDNGGIYFDTDVELLKKPDFLLNNSFYIGVQQAGKFGTTGLGFGAERKNEVVKQMLEKYDQLTFSDDNKAKLACPYLNMAVLENLGYRYQEDVWCQDGMTIYPCRFFDPIAPGNVENLMCDDTVSIHHYSASWSGMGNRIKRKIFRIIGEERIHKIKMVVKNGN